MADQNISGGSIFSLISAVQTVGIQSRISVSNANLLQTEQRVEFEKMLYPGMEQLSKSQSVMKASAKNYYTDIYLGNNGSISIFTDLNNLCTFSLSVFNSLSDESVTESDRKKIINEWSRTVMDIRNTLLLLLARCNAEINLVKTTLETYLGTGTSLAGYLKKDIRDRMANIEKISASITQNISGMMKEAFARTGKILQLFSSVMSVLPMEQVVTSAALTTFEFSVSMLSSSPEESTAPSSSFNTELTNSYRALSSEFRALSREEQLLSICAAIITHARLYNTSLSAFTDGLSAASHALSNLDADIRSLENTPADVLTASASTTGLKQENWKALQTTVSAFI